MIDLKSYNEKEVNGLATLVRITKDTFAVSYKKFDTNNGEALPEDVLGGNISDIITRREELQEEVNRIDAFIAKFNALKAQDTN